MTVYQVSPPEVELQRTSSMFYCPQVFFFFHLVYSAFMEDSNISNSPAFFFSFLFSNGYDLREKMDTRLRQTIKKCYIVMTTLLTEHVQFTEHAFRHFTLTITSLKHHKALLCKICINRMVTGILQRKS